jgi:eukaryotic-like serine/threonine-protein kinase
MEFVDGETLADRLKRGPLPVDETLHIAKQVAEALEAAHQNGITHRDLKPANIKITPDGKVKVLDFGLAKMFENAATLDASNSPTLMSGTAGGVILGTAAYMSPEQARGKIVDKRTDI